MPRLTQSEIHSDFSFASETWSEYRAQVIAFYDNYPHSELNDHITREFNKKIRDLSQSESLYISPYNAGLRYIGDGVFTVDPLSFNPYFYIDAASSMLGVLESPSLDLNPAVPSTLDIITATRAGTATYTDASGDIQTASPNTVRVDHVQGEELTPTKYQYVGNTDLSDWGSSGITTSTDGTLAPDGNIANKYVQDNGAGSRKVSNNIQSIAVSNNTYTFSSYIKNAGFNRAHYFVTAIGGTGVAKGSLELSTGNFSRQGASGDFSNAVYSVEDAGNGWYRFIMSFNVAAASGTGLILNIYPEESDGSGFTGNGVDGIYIAMPQFEEGTTVSDFVANTTGSPKYFAAATYAPRVPMILVEPAATNTIRWSESSSAYNYGSGITLESSDVLAPNGQASAFKMTPDGSSYINRKGSSTYAGSWNTNDVVTMSVWLKTDGYDYFLRVGGFFGAESAVFDSLDGSVQSTGGDVISASSEDYGNGWFRYKVTYTFQNAIINGYLYSGIWLLKRDASNNPVELFYGTGETTGVLVYGSQFESGSVATSYIPTDNDVSGVTRAADDLVIDGSDFTDFYNQSEGTFYSESVLQLDTNVSFIFDVNNGGTQRNILYYPDSSNLRVLIRKDNVNSASLPIGARPSEGVLSRAAFGYATNNLKGSLDGGSVITDTSVTPPTTVNEMTIGSHLSLDDQYHLNGHIKRLIYWPHHSDNI